MTVLVRDQLANLLRTALQAAQADQSLPEVNLPPIELARPKVAAHGDYSSNLGMILAKPAKMAPLQIAQRIIAHLPPAEFVGKVEVAAPGYINFTLAEPWLARQVAVILENGSTWANLRHGNDVRVQVEHGSANPTGPLTIGSGRNIVIGDTLANLLSAAGYDVQREYYVNDVGSKVRKFGETVYVRYAQALGVDEPLPQEFYPGDFLVELGQDFAREYGDKYLQVPRAEAVQTLGEVGTQRVVDHVKQTCARMNIHYDRWYSERSLYDSGLFAQIYQMLENKGSLIEKDGAIWFASPDLGEDNDAVVIRSPQVIPNPEDRPTYFASDIAYLWDKLVLRSFDRAIYVWGADHHGDRPRIFAVAKALGLDPQRVTIILYQHVTLMKDGVEQKGSKSAGTAVALHEVIDEVGMDACRFMLLTRTVDSKLLFDLSLAKEQSEKNPVYYVQYAHARIASILRKAGEVLTAVELPAEPDVQQLTHPAELALIRKMLELPVIIEQAVRDLAPHHLTYYAQDLASTFSLFYRDCKVVDAEQPALTLARLQLCRAAKITLARTLELMGMSAPEAM
ncbi:arginyl-tRNA synthetase [Thermoflexales bacterium]|nr:arginyl-tRNA synthetase [Thermoflexales bacterium]